MNKFYMVTLSCIVFCASSFVDAKKPHSQKKLNKSATKHLIKRRYSGLNNCYFEGDYVPSVTRKDDDIYHKENTHGSSRGILADNIAKRRK